MANRASSKLDNLHYFVVLARCRSFTVTARQLRVTPSAVSQTISLLERSLNVRLFQRSTRQVRITAEGQRLFDSLNGVFEDFRAGTRAGRGSELSLGSAPRPRAHDRHRARADPLSHAHHGAPPHGVLTREGSDGHPSARRGPSAQARAREHHQPAPQYNAITPIFHEQTPSALDIGQEPQRAQAHYQCRRTRI